MALSETSAGVEQVFVIKFIQKVLLFECCIYENSLLPPLLLSHGFDALNEVRIGNTFGLRRNLSCSLISWAAGKSVSGAATLKAIILCSSQVIYAKLLFPDINIQKLGQMFAKVIIDIEIFSKAS